MLLNTCLSMENLDIACQCVLIHQLQSTGVFVHEYIFTNGFSHENKIDLPSWISAFVILEKKNGFCKIDFAFDVLSTGGKTSWMIKTKSALK